MVGTGAPVMKMPVVRLPKRPLSERERRAVLWTAYRWDAASYMGACGFVPDPWQVRFLRSGHKYRMLNCSRQSGKSTTVAVGIMHRAIFWPDSLCLVLSRGERQSLELMRKVHDAYRASPFKPGLTKDGAEEMQLANGSRIVALPGKEETVRGYSAVSVLAVDEASRVPDALFYSIRPMLAVSGGQLWTLSSPFGARGWWFEQYREYMRAVKEGRKPEIDYYEVPATEIPRIPAAFLEQELRNMGEWWFKQEYMCMFLDPQGAAFGQEEVDAAFEEDVIAWRL